MKRWIFPLTLAAPLAFAACSAPASCRDLRIKIQRGSVATGPSGHDYIRSLRRVLRRFHYRR